jgi:O-antigen/teichoic acid export membrane protein
MTAEPPLTEQELDRKILRSSGWVAVSYGSKNVLSMLTTLVLVRLLEPKAFGLVALASILILVLENIQTSGVGAALIYRRGDVKREAASLLLFAPVSGVVLYAVCFAGAPLYAWAFKVPELTDIVRVLSLLLIVRGFSAVPGAILERDMNFRARSKGEVGAGLVQVGVSVGLATAGAGVWSIVIGQLVAAGVQTTAFWFLVPWRPSPREASWSVLREMMGYGRFVSAGNILGLINRTIDNALVGRILGTTALGFYAIAFRLADFPTSVIGHIVGRVMFPAYSHLQHDPAAFRRAFIQNLQRVALVALPISVALIIAAKPIVLALLGTKWLPIVTPLRILGVYSLVRGFTSPCGAVYQAAGKPYLVPLWALPHTIVVVPALLLLTPRYGVNGAAVAMVTAFSASAVPALISAMRVLDLEASELLRSVAPSLICAGLLGLTLALLVPATDSLSAFASLALLATAGLIVYGAATALLARRTLAPMWVAVRGSRS